jgi:hypothetical protein
LLALFDPISEAPDAIPRLRRFIPDLAVRGKLVEQNPEDEPAKEPLAYIIEAKILLGRRLFISNKWWCSDLELEDDKYCDDGDLIFAWASFGPFIWNGSRAIYHYHIWKLPLHSPAALSRDYLCLYLLNKSGEIKASGHGISMAHMTKETMERLEVPLPPLAEQHRIVAKVDALMALCDQLEQQLSQKEENRRRLLEAVLQVALVQPQAELALVGMA